jgi:hypothetical protein
MLGSAINAEIDAVTAKNEASGDGIKLTDEEIAANEALARKKMMQQKKQQKMLKKENKTKKID